MGGDGAEGPTAWHRRGAHTIAQDRGSSIVFGMPRAAVERGAVADVSTLEDPGPGPRVGPRGDALERAVLNRV